MEYFSCASAFEIFAPPRRSLSDSGNITQAKRRCDAPAAFVPHHDFLHLSDDDLTPERAWGESKAQSPALNDSRPVGDLAARSRALLGPDLARRSPRDGQDLEKF